MTGFVGFEKRRGWLLTSWLVLMLVTSASTVIAALIFVLGSDMMMKILPIHLWQAYVFGILSILNLVFIIFLFRWKRWAFYGFCAGSLVALVINLFIRVRVANILVWLLGPLVLYLIIRPKRDLFE